MGISEIEIIKKFSLLKKNLKKDFSGFKKIKVAVLGDSATQFLTQGVRGLGYEEQFDFEIYEADYNQINVQILDLSSGLYQFKPDFVLIFSSSQKLIKQFYKNDSESFADDYLNLISNYYTLLTENLNTKVILFNFQEINDSVFGNFGNKIKNSSIYQFRKINFQLMELSSNSKNLFILDYNSLTARYGMPLSFNSKMYYTSDMVVSLDALPFLVKNIVDIISAVNGKLKKCVILDLDNTTWGGIIGDDGIENIEIGDLGIGKVFTEFQMWIKQLKKRGIIIAVCSKNDEQIAKEPFEKHPEMVLSLDDISVFVANWNNKADNIRYIQSVLNIGFDSMVFLDDNPVERNIVRTHLPEVLVPELPEDPSLYLEYLQGLNLFETASFSEVDSERTKQYQQEAKRIKAQANFVNEDDFLMSLNMSSEVKSFDKFTIPRVAQLTQRSNQFNLRTKRYTEEEVSRMSISDNYITLTFDLKDNYGENGLISVVILEKKENNTLFIDTWLMSCRVLKRGMENFVLNNIILIAKKLGFNQIIGEYIPSTKNAMVKDHYLSLGFKQENEIWVLKISSAQEKRCFIEKR